MTELHGEAIVLRPLAPEDAEPLRTLREAPEVLAWWGSLEPGFPLSDEPTATRFAIRSYEKAWFRRVGLLERSRRAEQGRRRDETSMERVEKSLVDSAS